MNPVKFYFNFEKKKTSNPVLNCHVFVSKNKNRVNTTEKKLQKLTKDNSSLNYSIQLRNTNSIQPKIVDTYVSNLTSSKHLSDFLSETTRDVKDLNTPSFRNSEKTKKK